MKRFASDRVAGLMERMGLEDDVAIESRLVSKTIESAQSRVEGFNFDMRKRVVEFDDVINRQRETIYAERDKVLRNEDLSDTVRTFLEDEIRAIVDQHLSATTPDDWGMEALAAAPQGDGPRRPGHDRGRALGDRQTRRRSSSTSSTLRRKRETPRARSRRAAEVGEADWALVERHGPAPDDRLAVGRAPDRDRRHAAGHRPPRLRPAGPAQRVPARGLPALRGAPGPDPPPGRDVDLPGHRHPPAAARCVGPRARASRAGLRGSTGTAGGGRCRGGSGPGRRAATPAGDTAPRSGRRRSRWARSSPAASPRTRWPAPGRRRQRRERRRRLDGGQARPGFTPTGERIGRNDPCWCGSGQKYKKCHGRDRPPRPAPSGTPPSDVSRAPPRGRRVRDRRRVLVVGWTTFRIWDVGNRDDRRPADAIVVLGAAQYDGRPSRDPQGPPRPRDRPLRGRPGAVPRRDRAARPRATGRPRRHRPAPTPSRRASRPRRSSSRTRAGRRSSRSAAVAAILRDHGLGDGAVRVGPDAHAARPADRPRRGDRGFGSPTATSPTDATLEQPRRGDGPRARRADALLRAPARAPPEPHRVRPGAPDLRPAR